MMECFNEIWSFLDVEPVLFLYMLSAFVKMPIFMSVIFQKLCLAKYSPEICANSTRVHNDDYLFTHSNRVFTYSSICLVLPSIFVSILIGSYADRYSRKIAMILPFVGLMLCDVSYIVQATYFHWSVYYLLISDILFGIMGGYSAVISTTLSYASDAVSLDRRSYKMALCEGTIGLGGTIGFLISGPLLAASTYANVFMILSCINFVCLMYIFLFIKEIEPSQAKLKDPDKLSGRCTIFKIAFAQALEFSRTVFKLRAGGRRTAILLILASFSASFLVFSGSLSIMYYYLQHQLNWSQTRYGVFRGVYYGSSTLMVMFVYPLLKHFTSLSDVTLACIGIVSRSLGSLMFAFPFSTWWIFCVPVFYMFNRFAATGMRSILSKQVASDEQGKIFAAISFIEGVCNLISSALFNSGLQPLALRVGFPGLSYAVMAALMVVSLVLLLTAHFDILRLNWEVTLSEAVPTNEVATSNETSVTHTA